MPDIRHIRIAPNTTVDIKDDTKIPNTSIGAAGGVAQLDANGKVPSSQLPSYVDDVLEYADLESFPLTGEAGKIYVAMNNNRTYRWSGITYVEISESLALGETSSTAYRGDRGKTAYDHASAKGSAFTAGMYKITTNSEGHVTAATAVAKSDITGLGIPGQDTTYSAATQSAAGLMSAADKTKLDGVATGATANVGTITGITMNGASKGTSGVVDLGTVITAHQSISGKADKVSSATAGDVATLDANGNLVDSGKTLGKSVPSDAKFTDTTYSAATQSAAGLMSAADKTKLDGVATGATANVGTITGIKMNGASKGTSGVVDLGTVITSHQDISGKVTGPSSATNNAVAIFDGTGGKTIKNSGFTIGKSVPSDAKFTDTTYSDMTGATSSAAGAHGLVPAPTSADRLKYLRGDGTWAEGSTVDISGKADKVTNATSGNFAGLDTNGNLIDSGHKHSDYLTAHTPMTDIANAMYPVGSIYTSVVSTSPATLFGIGTWEQINGKFLYACEEEGIVAGTTGGAKSVSYTPAGTNSGGAVSGHTLTTDEIPSHNHTFTGSAVTSGGQSQGHTHTFSTGYESADHTHGGWSGGINANHVHSGPSHSHGVGSYATGDKGAHDHYMNYVMANYWNGGNTISLGNGSSSMRYYGDSGVRPTTGAVGNHNHTISGTSAADGTGNTGWVSSDHAHWTTTGGVSANHYHSGTTGDVNQGHTHSVTAAGSIGSTGGGKSHSHGFTNPTFTGTAATIATMPPYLAVYMWKRTA